MVLVIIGLIFLILGLLCGGLLVAAPLAWISAAEPSGTLWMLFPAFTVLGIVIIMVGGKGKQVRSVLLGCSYVMLALAMISALGIVLSHTSFIKTAYDIGSLWYVLAIAGTLGIIGVASYNTDDGAASI